MAVVRAIMNVLAACVIAWLAPISVTAATAAPIFAYTYDSPSYDQPTDHTASERGPPADSAVVNVSAGQAAGDRASPGSSARLDAGTTAVTYAYDGTALPARVANRRIPGEERADGPAGDISSLQRSHVAAKGASRALPASSEAAALIQGAKPTGSALKSDAWHRAAAFAVDDIAEHGTVFRNVGGDGAERLLVQMPGAVNGVAGRFEWIVDGGSLTHQMFVRGGTINGIPIKP